MADVMTTRGPVSPADLGVTDYHEHLYVEPPAWLHRIDPDFALDSVEKSAAELKTFAAAGGRTLVELTAVDLGRKLVRVAASAHKETGCPIITHTTAGTMGWEQATTLIEFGVAAHRIALSHMDRNPDLGEHQRIARLGTYVGYDCFGKAKYGPESRRLALIRDMLAAGLGGKVLIGNDLGRPSYWRAYGGGPGLDYVLTSLRQR